MRDGYTRPKKNPDDRYRSVHLMLPPAIADAIKHRAAETFRSQSQVVIDALLAQEIL